MNESERTQGTGFGGGLTWLAALGVAVLLLAVFDRPGWDHKVISHSDRQLDAELVKLGADGWEVVSARRATDGGSAAYELILKRQRRFWDRAAAKPPTPIPWTPPASSTTQRTESKGGTRGAPGYPGPNDPEAKKILRACVNGTLHALENGKWVPFAIAGSSVPCSVK
jgi:hypothetical protein